MKYKKTLINDFYPMRSLENYSCDTLTIVAVARHAFLPELKPFNFEIGVFGINFNYDHSQLVPVEKINNSNLRWWKDFDYLFEIQGDNEYDALLGNNFGLKHIKNKAESVEELILELEKLLEDDCPVIVCCNAYHLFYTEHYQKTPGGLFRAYHHIIVYGINPDDNQVWVYDPTLTNYNGIIPFNEFVNALEDKQGVEDFEGIVYYTVEHNGKDFDDINRELLLWALDYYLTRKGPHIKKNLLTFFDDYIYYYNHFSSEDFKNRLFEYGFFFFRSLAFRRLTWPDFLEYYKNLEELDHLQEEIDAYKANNERMLGIANTLYANALKEEKQINLELLKSKLEEVLDEEKRIFTRLYEKIK